MTENAKSRLPRVLIGLALLAIGGYFAWRYLVRQPDAPSNVVTLSGRIEGDESLIASKVTGRIQEIRVREGDKVSAGDVIAILEDDQLRAREEQARASVAQADARVQLSQRQIGVLNQQLVQAQITVGQSRQDAQGRVGQAEASLAAAEADLAQAEAALKLTLYDRDAYTKLASAGAVSERRGREAVTAAETQEAVVRAARKRVDAAKGTLAATRAGLQNPDIRMAESAGIEAQILQAQADVAATRAEAARARAQLDEAKANRRDLQVLAPFSGTVATRAAEPGEVAAAGTTLITLIDMNKVYLRGYIAERQIGRIKTGQPARVYLDSDPSQPLQAEVTRIDPQAAFTPENTYFREDRVKQVVGVKVELREGTGFAKPGMPADGEILVDGGGFPDGKRR